MVSYTTYYVTAMLALLYGYGLHSKIIKRFNDILTFIIFMATWMYYTLLICIGQFTVLNIFLFCWTWAAAIYTTSTGFKENKNVFHYNEYLV